MSWAYNSDHVQMKVKIRTLRSPRLLVKEKSNDFLARTLSSLRQVMKACFLFICVHIGDGSLQVISKNKNITKVFINVWNKIILTAQGFKYKVPGMGTPRVSTRMTLVKKRVGNCPPLPPSPPTEGKAVLSKRYWASSNTPMWKHLLFSENSKGLHRKALQMCRRAAWVWAATASY